jgi:putative flippase GtrA
MNKSFLKKSNIFAAVCLFSMGLLMLLLETGQNDGNIWNGENDFIAAVFCIYGVSFVFALWYYFRPQGEN